MQGWTTEEERNRCCDEAPAVEGGWVDPGTLYRGSDGVEDLDMFSWPNTAPPKENTSENLLRAQETVLRNQITPVKERASRCRTRLTAAAVANTVGLVVLASMMSDCLNRKLATM